MTAEVLYRAQPAETTKTIGTASTLSTIPTPPPEPQDPRTISELISLRAKEHPDLPILSYPSSYTDYVDYTHAQLDEFAENVAAKLSERIPPRLTSSEPESVVAILGPSNLDYFITVLGLTRLGFTVLFLSTRLADAAYISLLQATKCNNMVIHSSFQRTGDSLQKQVSGLGVYGIPEMSEYSEKGTAPPSGLNLNLETEKISWIIHSSGSTGMPKPIYQTHSAALRNYQNNMNMKGFITLPLFHAHGLSSVFRALTSNKQIHMYNADLPLTQQSLMSIMEQHKFEIFYGVPYALKLLSEVPEGIKKLAEMKVVMFGGSACPDALGDKLVDGGVNLISHYGTTETGQLMTSFRPVGDKAWNYVREHEALRPYVLWEPRGGNLFELVVLEGWPSKVATNRDDGGYATKDLFEPHSTIKYAWKYAGRLDDTIVLVNGEKAIPIATEQAVRQCEMAKDAVIFGTGKPQLGMIIVASEKAKDLSTDQVIKAIWPAVEECNKSCPAYAQLVPEMVRVLPWDTTYPQTDKGTLIRQAFYRQFNEVIEQVYMDLEQASNGTLCLSEPELRDFIRKELLNIIVLRDESALTDTTDFFALGVDSLQAIRLRAVLTRELDIGGAVLSQNVVFEHPTIDQLAKKLYALRTGKEIQNIPVEEEMQNLFNAYGSFPAHVPVQREVEGRHVVVTGATGSLGAHIVVKLAADPNVKTIWALVRADSPRTARIRVIQSMRERAVYHTLSVTERRKIFALPSNFSKDDLDLGEMYENIARKVTHVIHCAWSVNFNKSLRSFEHDCIAGTRNLILLCLKAKAHNPASFSFCSSVSAVARVPGGFVPEALPESMSHAQGMGYAQSKLVTEHIVCKAAEQTGMHARVLRVGQIFADTQHGIWNDTEAIPIMLQAAVTMGAIPALDENPRWLPVDVVAQSVLDVSLSSSDQKVFNIVNPKAFHWTKDLIPALRSAGLEFEAVSQREWIARLRKSNPDPVANPPIKLLDFFASKYDNDVTKRPGQNYDTTGTQQLSPALRTVGTISLDNVQKFITHFLNTSWRTSSSPASTFPPQPTSHILVFDGLYHVDKTTLARQISHSLSAAFVDGDSIHDSIAVSKVSTHEPLSSLDRAIWLARLKLSCLELLRSTSSKPSSDSHHHKGSNLLVVSCSALTIKSRDSLRDLAGDESIKTHFIVLQEEKKLPGTAQGQPSPTLEDPAVDEVDILPLDAGRSIVENADEVLTVLKRDLAEQ